MTDPSSGERMQHAYEDDPVDDDTEDRHDDQCDLVNRTTCNQRSYSYAKIFVSARSLRDLNEVTPPGGRRSRKQ